MPLDSARLTTLARREIRQLTPGGAAMQTIDDFFAKGTSRVWDDLVSDMADEAAVWVAMRAEHTYLPALHVSVAPYAPDAQQPETVRFVGHHALASGKRPRRYQLRELEAYAGANTPLADVGAAYVVEDGRPRLFAAGSEDSAATIGAVQVPQAVAELDERFEQAVALRIAGEAAALSGMKTVADQLDQRAEQALGPYGIRRVFPRGPSREPRRPQQTKGGDA